MQHVAPTAHLVRLDLLEAVRPEILIRFLRLFEDYLTSRGVALDGVSCDAEWIAGLHAVLNAVDPEMPAELQQGLLDVADLTTESAHEQLLSIARTQQLELFAINARTTPENLAFEVAPRSPRCLPQRARSNAVVGGAVVRGVLREGRIAAGGPGQRRQARSARARHRRLAPRSESHGVLRRSRERDG